MTISHDDSVSSKKQSSHLLVMIGLVTVCCLAGGFLLFRSISSDNTQQEIRDVLERRATALQQKDLDQYLSCFSQQYQSKTQTYTDLQTSAAAWFTNFVTIRFSFQMLDIRLQKGRAVVENTYTFSVTNADGESRDISNKELLELRREQQGWKIFNTLSIQ